MSDLTKKIALGFAALCFSTTVLTSQEVPKQQIENNITLAENSSVKELPVYNIVSATKAVGNKASDFSWTQDGKTVKFSEFTKGKLVFLNFWATWCGPCRNEIPEIIEISSEMAGNNVVVIGIALPNSWDKASVDKSKNETAKYVNAKQITYPILFGTSDVMKYYGGIQSIPTSFFINEKGEIMNTIVGSRSKEDFVKEINKMIKQ